MSRPFASLGAGVAIAASTTSASGNITAPAEMPYEIRVVNGSTSIAYVNVGATAENTHVAVAPSGELRLEQKPGAGGTVAVHVLLGTGTGTVSAMPGRSA